jgi:DNA-binding NtrC family response regulator
VGEPLSEADVLAAAKALARGEAAVLAGLDPAAQEALRALGARILALEEHDASLEASLVDMRMAVRGYSRLKKKLREENEELAAALDPGRRAIVGAEGGLADAMRVARKVLDTPLPVLISGESGTGKEVIARYIHDNGPRREAPFVAINCAALPETLLESELFGIEKGVATGVAEHAGKFEQANGGTLLLDEVGDMTVPMQAKILRALQEREVERVGARAATKVDVRVISATNKNLRAEVAARRFREDLFYRLCGVEIFLPPLRARRADIDLLLAHFLEETGRRFHRPVRSFSPAALAALRTYDWPGNVRELIVEVQRAVALAEGDRVEVTDLTPRVAGGDGRAEAAPPRPGPAFDLPPDLLPLREARRRFERAYIEKVLAAAAGSRMRAAALLGVTREGLRKKLQSLGLAPAPDDPVAGAVSPAPRAAPAEEEDGD